MSILDQLAAERRLEHKIEDSCERLTQDLEVIRDRAYVKIKDLEHYYAVDTYLGYAETYILKARLLLLSLKSKETH